LGKEGNVTEGVPSEPADLVDVFYARFVRPLGNLVVLFAQAEAAWLTLLVDLTVDSDRWITTKNCLSVGDIELGLLLGPHISRMRLVQEHGLFAEYRARYQHTGDLHSVIDDLYAATPKKKQLVRL
jgi:hypothetical protein